MAHKNIAIFISHKGCPHICSFCNQKSISGVCDVPTAQEVTDILTDADGRIKDKSDTEIAFFGGSFTAIGREQMVSYLEAAKPFLGENGFDGIRISTRPDYIDDEVLSILKEYGVTTIELGAQSMRDEVLNANERGHDSDAVRKASALIRSYGFDLGLQMMVGLYKSTPEDEYYTAHELAALKPVCVRIYPVAILENTKLAELYKSGEFVPYSFQKAVEISADLLEYFEENSINVIKLGLHSSETVGSEAVGGFYHPAFRELCEGYIFRKKIAAALGKAVGYFMVCVSPKAISKAVGQKKSNIGYFRELGQKIKVIGVPELSGYDIQIRQEEREKNVS